MHELEKGDVVRYQYRGSSSNGVVVEPGKTAKVFDNLLNEIIPVRRELLEYVPPVLIGPEQMRRVCRFETTLEELRGDAPDYAKLVYDSPAPYVLTLEDVRIALVNITRTGIANEAAACKWYNVIHGELSDHASPVIVPETTPEEVPMLRGLPGRQNYIFKIFFLLLQEITDSGRPISANTGKIIDFIDAVLADEQLPPIRRHYSDVEKEFYLEYYSSDAELKNATGDEKAAYRQFAEELSARDNVTALEKKGYGCYGGNAVFSCDWDAALDCIERAFDLTGNPAYANTLGYIYYYGRCWKGVPQYKDAFYYFSIGAAGHYYESRYKISDMFLHGYGVPKNKELALDMIRELYDENIEYILRGEFDCKFADVALRLGSLEESEDDGRVPEEIRGDEEAIKERIRNNELAYYHFLQADFAIRQRLTYGYYGDNSVAETVAKRLKSIVDCGKVLSSRSDIADIRDILYYYLGKNRPLEVKLTYQSNGDVKFRIRLAKMINEKKAPKMFVTHAKTGFCGMLEEIHLTLFNGWADVLIGPGTNTGSTDWIRFDDATDSYFNFQGLTVVRWSGALLFTRSGTAQAKKYTVASVRFSPDGKLYDYIIDNGVSGGDGADPAGGNTCGIVPGDFVLVETDSGPATVKVINVCEKKETELFLPLSLYKKVIGKA